MAVRGINNDNLKRENRGIVLKLIATGECTTRIELAKETGLSKMSVTNIVTEFMEEEIVRESNTELIKGQGRNPICLCISEKAPKLIGLFVHRGQCIAVLCDIQLHILKRAVIEYGELDEQALLQAMFSVIDQVMPLEERILGIGVGAVGPVDIQKGMILNPPNFYGIRDFAVTKPLQDRYELPVYLDSQYNCAALAEKYFGIGKDYKDFAFVGITNGIGSGVVSNDMLLRNSHGLTSELGHVSIYWQGEQCSCGNKGCLELYAGVRRIEKKYQEQTGRKDSFPVLCKRSEAENLSAMDGVFRQMMEQLSCGLVGMVNLVHPGAIIIGHEGVHIPEHYLKYLEELVNTQKLSGNYRQIVVKKSYFGEDAHLLGCACTVLNKVFEGEQAVL
ncbi:MAG: ROK family transcriptional regulator [Lachnospiraceae bacterium]|nr:ROK family transcriptional regulator [Lachnospiraceae bacterium]